jgi:hypothetical protein
MVLAVNMLSFKKYHVKNGKVKYDIQKIRNRGPQTSPHSS